VTVRQPGNGKHTPTTIRVDDEHTVSALLTLPAATAKAGFVLAHGAGAGMTHPFLTAIANGLAERGIATLRYNFPYMEAKKGRPDRPPLAEATVQAAVAEAARLLPGAKLAAGGKSFGGRMTSGAEASRPMPVAGLAFLGFPLHPPGKPGIERAEHLKEVRVPMLFLQGTRDDFAELDLLQPMVKALGRRATLKLFPDADHSFHVPKASGRTDAEVRTELLDTLAAWIDRLPAA
jgi:predicted alpha/beta-hydrolase family hydrolase